MFKEHAISNEIRTYTHTKILITVLAFAVFKGFTLKHQSLIHRKRKYTAVSVLTKTSIYMLILS